MFSFLRIKNEKTCIIICVLTFVITLIISSIFYSSSILQPDYVRIIAMSNFILFIYSYINFSLNAKDNRTEEPSTFTNTVFVLVGIFDFLVLYLFW